MTTGQPAILLFLALLVSGRPGEAQTTPKSRPRGTAIISAPADSLRTWADSNPDTPLEDPIVAADVAAIKTARIVVVPDSIVLIIGEPVLLFERYHVLAYDGAGNALAGFVPFVETEDRSLVRRDGPRTIGVKEGVTRQRITPMVFHPEYRGSTAEAFVRLYIRAR